MKTQAPFMIAVANLVSAKHLAMWGTYGKNGTEPLKWVRLMDCSSEHLQAILDTQPLDGGYRIIIKSILEDRE